MKRKMNLCVYLLFILPVLIFSGKPHTCQEIDNSWIQVPWSNGGHYYHNTLTREDRDTPPVQTCKNRI